ncbi:MAG: 7,8-didemethyl-8-hydroxy-5-deazariboflavin synthase subunit 1 / 7,8-didemethyl-8-hydroxy-5-deazariboflavin synthase subunit 2, partial [uncultured Nocardioidaceae bacterium]
DGAGTDTAGGTPRTGPRPSGRGARRRGGHGPPGRAGTRPHRAGRRRRTGPGRRAPGGRTAGGRHLLPQGLRPADAAVPRPLPLLHLRDGPRQAGRRRPGGVPLPRPGPRRRPPWCRARLHRGAVHPGRPTGGPVARGAAVARRGRVRLDAGLPPRDGGARARGDRPAAAPQPRGAVVVGAQPAQAGGAVDGDDARDDLDPAVGRARSAALRLPGQGAGRPAAGAGGRRPPLGPLHHRRPRRDRRDAAGARGGGVRPPPGRPRARARAGGDRPELPCEARHRDALGRRPGTGAPPRRDRRHPPGPRPPRAGAGAAEPRRPRGVPGAARRGHRRLRRHLPAHARPRQPRAAVALAGPAALPVRRRGPGAAGAADRPPGVRRGRRAVARPAGAAPRRRPCRRDRTREARCPAGRAAVAGAGRRRSPRRPRPHRPARQHRHHRPLGRPALGLRRGLRRLGRRARGGGSCRRRRRPGDCTDGGRPRRPRGAPAGRAGPAPGDRRPGARPRDCRGSGARGGLPARRRAAARRGRRRRDLRGQPQHQPDEHLLHRLSLLRLRAATDRRRCLLVVAGAGGRPRRGGVGARCDRGVHAGRDRSRAARDGVLRPRLRGQAARPGPARPRLQSHGGRQRRLAHRAVGRGLAAQGPGGGSRHDPRDRGGDPRRRGPLGAHQGQAPHQRVGRGRDGGARARHPVERDDDVRPRRPPAALGRAPAAAGRAAGPHRRLHRVRPAALRPHQRPDLPRRGGPPRPDAARQPRRPRPGAGPAPRPHPERADQLGQARHRGHAADAPRRRERPRRHAHGGDDLPDGRLAARVGADGGRAHRGRRGHRPAGPPADHHVRRPAAAV